MKWGLAALKDQRLKQAIITELNDPFEHIGVDLSDKNIRKSFITLRTELAKSFGIICMSEKMSNPLLWSHYTDKHKGLCLAFDFSKSPQDLLLPVNYLDQRIPMDKNKLRHFLTKASIPETMEKLLAKFSDWRYEKEVRFYASLTEKDPITGHYYLGFNKMAYLSKVYIGAEAKVSKADMEFAMSAFPNVEVEKVRIGFQNFEIVRQQDKSRWYDKSADYKSYFEVV
ncbi:DUF2971 domain-containing protein [Methylovorus sp. MM2]|uniref:DUF2971 domain-containing protein n=1 Tax=Methylovorus sp. MM2 TaxID=1848038 RepID=UPI0013F4BF34|nr:DUF2971 domain-containing protein [Methylovorus sp. MM2]